MLVSVVQQLCPEGSVRKLARFTGGLLLLCAMLRPLTTIELPGVDWDAGGYREAVARLELELGAAQENTMAEGIAAELEAYIEDKAESLGANVQAIEAELGVTKERQTWTD